MIFAPSESQDAPRDKGATPLFRIASACETAIELFHGLFPTIDCTFLAPATDVGSMLWIAVSIS
jgi:hypothetical protein